MEKRTVEKASAGCEKGLFGNVQPDSEKELFADAQSLRQSSLRCGTRFVGAAEELNLRRGARPFGNAQSLRQSSPHGGTRFVDAAEEPELGS